MPFGIKTQRPARLTALLVALCYLWFGAVVPFQHTHGVCEDAESVPAITQSATRSASVAAPRAYHVAASKSLVTQCIACDWQAVISSPALAVLHWDFTPEFAPRVITTFPRYLPVAPVSTSSRGPPAV